MERQGLPAHGEAVLPAEAQGLRAGIRALVRRFSISERADVQCCGMTVAQAATVQALEAGPLRQGELGKRLGITPSTLTRNLKRLEDGGHVRRTADPEDGRASRVELSREGRRTAARLEEIENGFAAGVLVRLAPERRRRALEGLADLLEALRAQTEECCGGAYDHLLEGAASCRSTAVIRKTKEAES